MQTTVDLSNVAELAAASTTTVQVSSVPTACTPKHYQLVMQRKSTAANPVAETERYRVCNVPEGLLMLPQDSTRSKFHALLQQTILDLAREVFSDWAKQNLSAVQFDAQLVHIDAVLQYWATVQESQRISGERISEWLETCETLKGFADAKAKAWKLKLPKMAAPSYQGVFSKADCTAIAAQIVDADAAHPVAVYILNRCGVILNKPDSESSAL